MRGGASLIASQQDNSSAEQPTTTLENVGGGWDTMLVAVMEIEYEDLRHVPISERSE